MAPQGKWKKVLYEDNGFADNYVDDSFLDELKKNLHTQTYSFWSVVRGSGVVTQQISSVCLFVVLFIYMDQGYAGPDAIFMISSVVTLFMYVINNALIKQLTDFEGRHRTVWDDLRTLLIFVGFGYGLSPVLMTLTRTVSTDTIYAMSVFMFLASLLFHDYGANAALVSQSISLNAVIFSSVCLASRLSTTWHTFVTLTCAMEIFALAPMFRKNLRNRFPQSQVMMTVFLGVTALVTLATVSLVGAVLFLLLHIFVTFVCPLWLIKLQRYKNTIHGPWDEAVIKD